MKEEMLDYPANIGNDYKSDKGISSSVHEYQK